MKAELSFYWFSAGELLNALAVVLVIWLVWPWP
jgi:hypothetical protein